MADQGLIDALPYTDAGDDDLAARTAALALIEEEKVCSLKRPVDYLEPYPALNPPVTFENSAFTKNELERIAAQKQLKDMDTSRYEAPAPSASATGKPEAWEQSLSNAQAQLLHLQNRGDNLELLQQYGPQVWRTHTAQLEQMEQALDLQLKQLSEQEQALNWQRKQEQVEAGQELLQLETKWGSLISKNFEVEMACMALQAEIGALEGASAPAS
eukprot:m.295930 g.295930  ORF g.295930 m.295930 type:complete len:215 (-) comp19517_c1_seq1:104-748(-)